MIYVNRKNNKTLQSEKHIFSAKVKNKKPKTVIFGLILAVIFFVLLLCFPSQSAEGVKSGISLCINTLIPSLFPFMFASSLLAFCLHKKEKRSERISLFQKVFGINGTCGSALLLSIFGGYPVGAVTVSSLYKSGKITETQASLMIYIAFGSGMGFLVSYTGATLFSSRTVGILLFVSQIISVTLMVFLSRLFLRNIYHRIKKESSVFNNSTGVNLPPADNISDKSIFSLIFHSALSAGKSAFNMCLVVILFSSALSIISSFLSYNSFLRENFYAVWEVSNSVQHFSNTAPLWFIGFITGFGGICVHVQVFFAAENIRFSKAVFFVFRVIQGFLNGLTVYILTLLFPLEQQSTAVFSSVTESPKPIAVESPLKFVILILVCFCFLFSLGQKLTEPKLLTLVKEKFKFTHRR